MKVGDRVMREPMWKYPKKEGVISKITADYIVVKWDNVNGEWHYTHDQAKNLNLLEE